MARRRRFRPYLRLGLLALALLAAGYTLYLDLRVRHEFEGRRFALPARIYARPLELHVGLRVPEDDVVRELHELGYRPFARPDGAGWYVRNGAELEIALRPFVFWDGPQPAKRLRVSFAAGAVSALADAQGVEVALARLEPVPIGGIYPTNNEDRLLVRLGDVPKVLVKELIAVEDRNFYHHWGFDPRGIARALLSLPTGHVQGGSTLTQQLVKNFFLTPERTLRRKATELVMAVLLELNYSKQEILETYLNEIYLGQDRDRAIHGVGLAAQFYFDKPVRRLTPAESALLVGLVRGPGYYDPYRHPQRALERRNLVLRETRDQGSISAAEYQAARATGLGLNPSPSTGTTRYPAFVDLVHRQLRRDYDEADLRSDGLRIFSTLDPRVQAAAEHALSGRLAVFDRQGRFGKPGLEGAVVVADPQTGEVQALVGGRDPRYQGYNRALDAERQIGSLFKPAIYLTALEDPARYTLATLLDDSKFVWQPPNTEPWRPENYDRQYHGQVPLYLALAHSYNVAAARLGTTLGLDQVLATARQLGIERPLPQYPATLLGAANLTPLEVAQMYQTIASGGFRSPLHAIRDVTTADGHPLKRYPLAVAQAFPPDSMYLLTAALQGVVREGTAQSLAKWLPPALGVAGKTGTTNEQRDAWFAGFTGGRVAVVWVGYDDNRPARLLGATAALPVWGEMMAALEPEPVSFPQPEDIAQAMIDPQSGLLADPSCPGALELPFVKASAPLARAPCAGNPVVDNVKGFFQRLLGQ
ncbi:MAG: penicillin-binding protein 1B [Burkholderiales bacterium]